MINKAQKAYRFAVYGRAASGKTCILAALAMKCVAHPSQFTSTWILEPAGLAKPQGEPETWDAGDRASAFHFGKIWLEKAIERLARGELPPPNPNRAEPLRYLYHFTTPSHRTYPVELIDYSGELIDPSLSNDEMARRLREHLRTMDGILVLAEVPRPEDEANWTLSEELLKLQQAFAILKNESREGPTLDLPLALLFNKWDRRSSLRYTTPENEYLELHRFLEKKPEPPHKALVDALKYSVTRENFQIFPVSAFGEHEFTRGPDNALIERPRSVAPLQSFGLEDGFIWAAQRRDTIDIGRFLEQISEKSVRCFLKNASVVFSLPLIRRGRELARRFPAGSEERGRIRQALKRYYLTVGANLLCLLFILFALFAAAEGGIDNFRYRAILAAKSDPQATLAKLRDDEAWLVAYYRAPFYRHLVSRLLVLKSSEALATLRAFRDRREEMQWRPVAEASDELVRAELARKYLQQFGENGIHADQASTIVTAAEQSKKFLGNQNYVANIATALDAALLQGAPSEDELEKLYQQLLTLPFPEAVTAELDARQKKILARLAGEKIKLAREQGKEQWLIYRDQYFQAMREGDIVQAAEFLERLRGQAVAGEESAKLAGDFRQRAVREITGYINEKSRQKLWGPARNILQQALDSPRLVAQLGAAQIRELQNLQGGLDQAEDMELYAQLVKYRDLERAGQYLKYAPLNKMAPAVSRYQQYLLRQSNPLELKLVLAQISWGEGCRRGGLQVTLNGKSILEKADLGPVEGTVSAQLVSASFREKLSDLAKLQARITCASWWSEESGEGNWEGAVGSLDGLRLQLEGKAGGERAITFRLSGLPEEPVLPAWGS